MYKIFPDAPEGVGLEVLVDSVTVNDLRRITNEIIDVELSMIAECMDEDVVFVPVDPKADDPYASNPSDVDLPWTLGHVIVHATASSEESAYLAVELARGVPYRGGRSRYETAWEEVTTIKQCRDRLEESRRMRLASLDMWPNNPDLNNTFETRSGKKYNAIARFVFGLLHEEEHLSQIKDIVRQAVGARNK